MSGGLRWKIDYPIHVELWIDKVKITRRVATRVATEIRNKAKAGQALDGSNIPKGRDGERAMWDTGETVKSIKRRRPQKGKPIMVGPSGYRSDRPGKPHALVANSVAKQKGIKDLFGVYTDAAKDLIQKTGNAIVKRAQEDKDFRLKVKKKARKTGRSNK